jgi:ribonuclease T1
MRIVRSILLITFGLFILYVKFVTLAPTPSAPTAAAIPGSTIQPAVTGASVPTKVLQVLQIIRTTGLPPEGYVGGRTFENREGRLPGGDYREFDVDPHHGQRNAERIIVEWNTKKAWYTADHYQTFTPLP